MLLVALCAAMFLPRLGVGGLSYTEGHRAIPAWEMLESGELLVTTMFDRPYMRKPPGIAWAIGASSLVFGQTELAARFGPVADALASNEERIVGELNDAQGSAQDLGGYYRTDPARASAAMRPSATFNEIVDSI